MYRGDDVFALVVDVGSSTLKAGYAGDDAPQCVIPTDVGMVYARGKEGVVGESAMEEVEEAPSHYHAGTNALSVHREGMEIKPIMENGLISDWAGLSKLLSHTFIERLQVDPKEHPILMSEPSFNSAALREKMTELLFEEHGTPALFVAKSAVLASFAHGRATSIVLESGAGTTAAVPVHDGYVLQKAIVKSHLAGDELTRIYEHVIRTVGQNPIQPNYSITKKVGRDGDVAVSKRLLQGLNSSFHRYHVHQLTQDIKEATVKLFETELDLSMPIPPAENTPYVLPDNTVYTPGIWKYQIPEIMFNPATFTPQSYSGYSAVSSLPGLQQMLYQSINACDTDLKKDLYQNILFTGGNTIIPGFAERSMAELSSLFGSQIKLKNQSLPTAIERRNAVFIGGSILGSLGTFHQMWISRQEYDEHGKGIVERKCP
jgi:actin-like protein 6A